MDTVYYREVYHVFLRCHLDSLMNWCSGGWDAFLCGLRSCVGSGGHFLEVKRKRCLQWLIMIAAFA